MTTHWNSILKEEVVKPYYSNLMRYVEAEYAVKLVYPPMKDIFSAIRITPFNKVKVVIVGQDPYFGPNQANGLSFSVRKGSTIPPSLSNIFSELTMDVRCPYPKHGDLTVWATRGVLLLNTVLTVRAGEPNSHRGIGWETLTSKFISELSRDTNPKVFILWGKAAQEQKKLIYGNHLVIESSHPSPHSAHLGFYGSKPFSTANNFLVSKGLQPVEWCL